MRAPPRPVVRRRNGASNGRSRHARIGLTLLVWLLLTAAPARADDGGIVEDSATLTVEVEHHRYALESFAARPAQGSRFPVALIVHGAAESDARLRELNLSTNRQWARTLATRGWLAVSFARRGYASSDGTAFLRVGTCEEPAAGVYLDRHADDVEAALRAVAKRPDADMSRVMLIGKSVGGAVALDVASRKPFKIAAVVNVSGGLSAYTRPLSVNPACGLFESDVVWNFARFGAASRTPTLWFYAENDPWFSPAFVGRLHTAYTAAGGHADLRMLPAFPPDGHELFHRYSGQEQMLPVIDAFLRDHGLPTWDTGLADRMLPTLKPEQRQLALRYLREVPAQKAFAVPDGDSTDARWDGDPESADKAKADALRNCEKSAGQTCHLVAVNFNLVPVAVKPDGAGH
jgi:dienelactone hydrolase